MHNIKNQQNTSCIKHITCYTLTSKQTKAIKRLHNCNKHSPQLCGQTAIEKHTKIGVYDVIYYKDGCFEVRLNGELHNSEGFAVMCRRYGVFLYMFGVEFETSDDFANAHSSATALTPRQVNELLSQLDHIENLSAFIDAIGLHDRFTFFEGKAVEH